jgi:hypothetical protein
MRMKTERREKEDFSMLMPIATGAVHHLRLTATDPGLLGNETAGLGIGAGPEPSRVPSHD